VDAVLQRELHCSHLPTDASSYQCFSVLFREIHYVTPWSRFLLDKTIVPHLVKKYNAFYANRKFITVFATARHMSLSYATLV